MERSEGTDEGVDVRRAGLQIESIHGVTTLQNIEPNQKHQNIG